MTPDQTKQVVAKIALVDNRRADVTAIAAWHEVIGHLDYDVAMEAVTIHRRESIEYLMPAHIIAAARRVKSQRSTDIARQRAIEAKPAREMEFADYQRMRERPEFKAAFEEGRRRGNAERAYKTEMRRTGSTAAASAAYRAELEKSHEA